jgi:hypothetical protein
MGAVAVLLAQAFLFPASGPSLAPPSDVVAVIIFALSVRPRLRIASTFDRFAHHARACVWCEWGVTDST